MSVGTFATHARVDCSALEALERGESDPGVASLFRIVVALGLVDKMALGSVLSELGHDPPPSAPMAWTGWPGTPLQSASCVKFRAGVCHELLVYQAFRPLFGD